MASSIIKNALFIVLGLIILILVEFKFLEQYIQNELILLVIGLIGIILIIEGILELYKYFKS
jgi:hypothetical protein